MCSTHNAARESLMKNHSNIPTGTESASVQWLVVKRVTAFVSNGACLFYNRL